MAPHSHEECSFTIVLDGAYRENICGRDMEHRSGAMLFYPAGELHSQSFGPTGSRKLIFRPDVPCLEFLEGMKIPLAQAPSLSDAPVRGLARRVVRELLGPDSFSEMVMEGTLLELVGIFGRTCETSSRYESIPSWLKECRALLEQQSGNGMTHEVLAAHVQKHPVHVAKAFRKAYGETIGDCQRRLRLEKAESLLRKVGMPLAELALECGFASQGHFSRSFKAAFGMTPTYYRNKRR